MRIPLLPMQAWALKNAKYDLRSGFVNWLRLPSEACDFNILLRSLRDVVRETEELRVAFVEHDGGWAQTIAPYSDDLVLYDAVESPDTERVSIEHIVATRHSLISNTRGANVAVLCINTGATFANVLMCNHFVLDFYSVAWLVRTLMRRYISNLNGKRVRSTPARKYVELCEWLSEKARGGEVSREVLRSLRTSTVPDLLPIGVNKNQAQGRIGDGGNFEVYARDFSKEAAQRFWRVVQEYRMSPYALGLALSTYRKQPGSSDAGIDSEAMLINIKESWRGISTFNTIDIPSFLAVTSALVIRNDSLDLREHVCRTRDLLSSRVIGYSTANFELHDADSNYLLEWNSITSPLMLYNSLDLRAVGAKSGTEHLFGVYRTAGYSKREHIEVRFIFTSDKSVSVWCAYRPCVLQSESVIRYIENLALPLEKIA